MSQVRVLVMYDGKWFPCPNGYYVYNGGKTKGIILPENITHQELVHRLYGVVKVDPNKYVITMKSLYKANIPTMPVEIVDDDDVRFFIQENVGQATDFRSPLCVTLELQSQDREGNYVALDHRTPAASRSESNQHSVVTPGLQATEVEEQNLNAYNNDPAAVNLGTEAYLGCGDGVVTADVEVGDQHDDVRCNDKPWDDCIDKLPVRRSSDTSAVNPSNLYDDLASGRTFASKKDLRKKLKLAAMKDNFAFKVTRSTKDRFEIVCADEKCKWRLRATKMPEDEHFEIRRFSNIHICTRPPAKQRKQKVSSAEEGSNRKCGRCGAIGHNRQTCKNFTFT